MAEVKTEYWCGVLKGIDLVQEAFVNFAIKDANRLNKTITISKLIAFIATYRAGVAQAIEKAEAEAESNGV